MVVRVISVGVYKTNCYLLMDEDTKEAAIIDPGENGNLIRTMIGNNEANICAILLTHGHMDHTGAVRDIKNHYDVPIYINEKDHKMMEKRERIFGKLPDKKEIIYIKEGSNIKIGNLNIKCIETPGHTPGGMSFLCNDILFSGDTLFKTSVGRTDLPGGDFEALMSNIVNKLMNLKDETIVLPGHGPKSSIGYERTHNDFLI